MLVVRWGFAFRFSPSQLRFTAETTAETSQQLYGEAEQASGSPFRAI